MTIFIKKTSVGNGQFNAFILALKKIYKKKKKKTPHINEL